VVANATAAQEAGAVVKTYAEVVEFLKVGSAVVGVLARDTRTGVETEYRGSVTFNATGPWLMGLCAKAGVTSLKIRPSKGVHLVLDRRFSNVAIIAPAIDGRMIFIIPHENVSLIGTTDDDYFGDPDRIPITTDEVEYLLGGIERVLPDVRKARVIRAFAALRPTLYSYGKMEDDLSRDHRIYDHGKLDQVHGLFSIAGGKLAAYRIMCEEAVDKVLERLGMPKQESKTHATFLPGGEETPGAAALAEEYGMAEHPVARLVYKHGARARAILERTLADPAAKTIVCPCEGVTRAEIEHVVQNEWATTLSDVCRRTRLGMGPCQGCQCLVSAADVLAAERKLTGEQYKAAVKEFYEERFKGRRPVESGDSLAQEELNYAIHVCVGNLDTLIG
jgi:glycerol-3-phosphate dehydrogenase